LTKHQLVVDVAKRLKSNVKRQKHRISQRAKEIRLKEKFVAIVKVCPIVIKVLLHMLDKLHYPSRAHIHEGIEFQNKVLNRCLKQLFFATSNA
jgi:hypothetical protein